MTIATSYEQVTHNSPDGAQMGQGTGEKVAFYGSTPVVQPSSASQAAVTATLITTVAATAVSTLTTTAYTAVTTTAIGFTTATQADAITTRVNQLVVDVAVYDGKINQAVADIGTTTTLVNQLRSELVTLGLLAGS